MKPERVRWLLERGANPNWVAPNGIPVLEHALIRYWNGAAVDVLAERAVPRKALWIAAGLGDVDAVRRSLDGKGKPTPAARRLRPDFDAVAGPPVAPPPNPDPDDEDILTEAFLVAMLNGRTQVLEYLVSRGFPVNTLVWDYPLIALAVGSGWVAVVASLVRCGANLDLRGRRPNQSAREIAREMFEQAPHDASRRRILELCGMDPGTVLAERDVRPVAPPQILPMLREALALASDDAFRLGESSVGPVNLLVGVVRSGYSLIAFMNATGADVDRFVADMRDRLRHGEARVDGPELPLDPEAQAAMDAAIAAVTERRHGVVHGGHLLWALTRAERGAVADLLARYGASAAAVSAQLERGL